MVEKGTEKEFQKKQHKKKSKVRKGGEHKAV